MFSLGDSEAYYLSRTPTDMRKGFDSLCGEVRRGMGRNPLSGEVFIFYNKPSDVQYSINCATCAPAYALRLLGFDVKAKGRVAGSGTLNDSVAGNRSFEMWKNIDGTAATPTLTLEWMMRKGYKKMTEKRYREFLEESCKERGVYILTIGWRGGGGHATVLQRFEDGTLSYIEPQAFDSLQGARRSIDELCEKGAATPFYKRGVMRVDNKLFDTDFLSLFDK